MSVRRLLLPLLSLVALASVAVLLPGQDAPVGHKYALLVGVQRYDGTGLNNLKFCENDVTGLAEVLRGQKYNRVILLTRTEARKNIDRDDILPTAATIRDHLKAILEDRKENDTVLLAFSGHGAQLKKDGKTYFCPSKSNLDRVESLVSLDEVYEALKGCKAGTKVLLVDAFRNAPTDGKGKEERLGSVTRPLVLEPPGGTVALFSCSKGQQSFESEKFKRGYLFHHVIEGLKGKAARPKTGAVGWPRLVTYVTEELPDAVKVERGPQAKQTPEARGETRGIVLAKVRQEQPPLLRAPFDGKRAQAFQRAWAEYLGREVEEKVDLGGGVQLELVLIPAGAFQMGSPKEEKGRDTNEGQHAVTLARPFYLGKYEVTQEQYETLMGKNPSYFSAGGDGKEKVDGKDTSRFPVERVSWGEATEFCAKLSRKLGRKVVLPSEAEWEYACRAGTASPFHFGGELNGDKANFDGNHPYGTDRKGTYLERTCAVGSYDANGFGLFDMHGNVHEWCADWAWRDARVFRGGAWYVYARVCRAAFRNGRAPSERDNITGFRIAFRLD